jgi:hypothetical protein
MSAPTAKFALLLDLAKETSSERRRDLLREITNMLARDPSVQTLANCSAFDEIAVAVIADLKSEARSEISRMLAETTLPLGRSASGAGTLYGADRQRPRRGCIHKIAGTPDGRDEAEQHRRTRLARTRCAW